MPLPKLPHLSVATTFHVHGKPACTPTRPDPYCDGMWFHLVCTGFTIPKTFTGTDGKPHRIPGGGETLYMCVHSLKPPR